MKHQTALTILIALTSLAAPAEASAQTRQHHHPDQMPVYDNSAPKDLLEINPHINVGVSSAIQNYGSTIPGLTDLQFSPGCRMGGGLDVRFAIRNSLALGTGLDFSINNSRTAMSILYYDEGSINSLYIRNHYYNLTVPIEVSWRLNIGRRVRWNVNAGAYLNWALGGTVKANGYTSGINAIGQPVITEVAYETNYYNTSHSLINGVHNFDYGPRIATGLTYREHYTMNVVLQVGARNLAINHGVLNVRYHHVTFGVHLGYIL